MSQGMTMFYELCRLCLGKPGKRDICESEDFSEDIFAYTGVKVISTDNLPQKICSKCEEVIKDAKELRMLATSNDAHLRFLFEEEITNAAESPMKQKENSDKENVQDVSISERIDNISPVHSNSSKGIRVRHDLFSTSTPKCHEVTSTSKIEEHISSKNINEDPSITKKIIEEPTTTNNDNEKTSRKTSEEPSTSNYGNDKPSTSKKGNKEPLASKRNRSDHSKSKCRKDKSSSSHRKIKIKKTSDINVSSKNFKKESRRYRILSISTNSSEKSRRNRILSISSNSSEEASQKQYKKKKKNKSPNTSGIKIKLKLKRNNNDNDDDDEEEDSDDNRLVIVSEEESHTQKIQSHSPQHKEDDSGDNKLVIVTEDESHSKKIKSLKSHKPRKIKVEADGVTVIYKCEECHKKFDVYKKFYLHERTHIKTNVCPIDVCGKKFATKGDLAKHVRTHTGEKPYGCDVCGRKFAQRVTLRQHAESIHAGAM